MPELKIGAVVQAVLQIEIRNGITSSRMRHVESIDQYLTDIRHITGNENMVAYCLSQIDVITDHNAIMLLTSKRLQIIRTRNS